MADSSKTEKATSKKRSDERKKGNIFLSKDIVTLVSLLGMFFSLKLLFPNIYVSVKSYMADGIVLAGETTEVTNELIREITNEFIIAFAKIAAPLLFISILLAVAATVFQTKPIFITENLKPKFNKLNPINGIKNLFSLRSIVEIIKGVIKITILIAILYDFVEKRLIEFPKLLYMDLISSSTYILSSIFSMVMTVSIAFAAVSVLDYFYQWWEYERQIKMSKEEIKEEYKQMEGDPKVKGKIKETQRKMAMSRMMQAVPTADVVVKNPTHFAVALKYDPDKDNAPVVVAKGQDELALRIIRIAEENKVYVIENKPLARALYAQADVNAEIPPDYYGAIAELLVYVYRIKNKL
ncbi:flagellar biosynthesis protein FlhB [Anaerotignum faecicola]|nr:flagellar biosynthesis protein FlhB [Anaerotignum faecicola]